MTDKQQFLKKNIICSKLNLQAHALNLIESLYLELIIQGEYFKNGGNSLELSGFDQIKGIMKFILMPNLT